MRKTRHFFALALTVLMLFSNVFTTYAATLPSVEKNGYASGSTAVKITDVDPDTLDVPTTAAPDDKPEETAEKAAYRADEIVRVSIFLEGDSTIDAGYSIEGIGTNKRAIAYREKLEKQQDKMAAKISKEVLSGKELDVVWNLTLITNLISARVRYGDIEKIAKIKGVKEVVIEPVFQLTEEDTQPNMVNARDMTGSNGTNATKYQGAGSKLAIIDTGLDLEHQSFNEDAFLHAVGEYDTEVDLLTAEEVAAVWDQLNFAKQHSNYSAAGSYYNAKIPFIANYVDGNQDVTHLNDKQEEHGSHVAGIATANRYLKIDDQYVDAAETVGVVGQAPDAQIFVMKVFGSNGGASPTDYMAGVEDALILGADSVNLSLGSSNPGTTFDTSYTNIIEKLVKSGMVVCISAGNNTSWDVQKQLYADDINYHTGGSPGSFTYSFGVASVDDSGTATPYIVFDGTLESRYNEMPSDNPKALFTSLAGTYEYVYIDTVGNAAEFDALADQLAGKIVMCNRGTITFAEKANNSAAAGAAGTIIVNNQAGAMTGVSMGSDYQYSIPVIGILQSVGQDLKNQAEAHLSSSTGLSFNYYTGTIKIGSAGDLKPLDYYSMSSFSAWGVPGSLILKPEITTPGGSVMSLNGYHQNASGGGYSGGHDEYELMSGTSMAAPQVTGLVAAIAQYYREENIAERTGLTLRQFALSMLMATSVPLKEEASGHYYSLLNQGSGLANLEAAVTAKSFIRMSENDGTLTAILGMAADGKVKAEVGDDPTRSGEFTYTFTITNFSDETVTYALNTDLFTQKIETKNDVDLLAHQTTAIEGVTTYVINVDVDQHDVNKDGITDGDDVQAILDYLTKKVSGDDLDLEAAELDGKTGISTRDAYALLAFIKATAANAPGADSFTLEPGKTATVQVNIAIPANGELGKRENGGYVEGFTFITSNTDVTYSIPVLGYYGSWTDPSMFDAVTYVEKLYGSEQTSYFLAANASTNGLRIKNSSTESDRFVTGNPYVIEDKFPEDRLAISNNGTIVSAQYTLIRYGSSIFPAVTDEDGNVLWIGSISRNAQNAYYNTQSNSPSWQSTSSRTTNVNVAVSSLGLSENEKFTAGVYVLPEYYGIIANNGPSTVISADQAKELLTSGVIGKGALMGYTFTIDNTKPTLGEVTYDDEKITVTASDNSYIAYIAVMDVSGKTVYAGVVPEQSEPGQTVTVEFDRTGINANGVVVFVGDYAGNEDAALYRIGAGDILIERDIYVLTDKLEAGKDYLVVNTNEAGDGNALTHSGTTKNVDAVTIVNDAERGISINGRYVEEASVFSATAASSGVHLANGGYYLTAGRSGFSGYNISFTTSAPQTSRYFTYNSSNSALGYKNGNSTYYVIYSGGQFTASNAASAVYLYEKQTYTEVFDENKVEEVVVTPATGTIYVGFDPLQLTAEVLPITLADKTVTWSSSDDEVATVDANGVVTAVAAGTVTITATANADHTTSGSAEITVEELTKLNATINAQVTDESGSNFVSIDLNTGNYTVIGECAEMHNGGGRSESEIVGLTSSSGIVYTQITDKGYVSESIYTYNNSAYASRDGAHIPIFAAVVGEDVVTEHYSSVYVAANYLLLLDYESGSLFGWSAANLTAITYFGTDTQTWKHYYYTLSGTTLGIAVLGVDEDEPVDEASGALNTTLARGTIGTIEGLDSVSANDMSMTMLYDEENGYYGLLIVNAATNIMYFVNLDVEEDVETYEAVKVAIFDGVTRISTLYDDFFDGNIIGIAEVSDKDANVRKFKNMSVEKLRVQEIAKLVPIEKEADGSVNSVKGMTFVNKPVDKKADVVIDLPPMSKMTTIGESTTGDDGSALVEISSDELFENGLFEITYDPDKLTFVEGSVNTDADYGSVENDATNGVVTIAALCLDGLKAGETIASVTFNVSCDNSSVTVATKEFNEDLALEESVSVTVQGTGHDWNAPSWSWATDYSSATATFVCKNNSEHQEVLNATVTPKVTDPTCTEDGKIVYQATVTGPDGETYTDEQTVTGDPKTGHDWNAPSWNWATDYSSATATFVCKNNSEHQEVLNATVTPKVTDPTCTEDGKIVYQATVTGPDGETYTDEQTVTGDPKTGHDWNAPTWNWSDDNSSATATFVCKNDSTHTETIPATMSEEVTKEPTTEEEGLKTVTASVTGPDGEPYEDQKEVAIPKLKPVVPDTGDHSHLGAYAATTVISLLGMIIIIIRRKGALN